MVPRIIGLIIVCVAIVAGCLFYLGKGYSAAPYCKDCNVVIISIDPLRADGIHTLGNPLAITPTIDSLASHGYTFTNAFAVSSWTLPSVMSFMTSEYPAMHKVINKEIIGQTQQEGIQPASLSTNIETLAAVFKSQGYATGGFAGGAALASSYGFDRGFNEYQSDGDFEGLAKSVSKALEFVKGHPKDKIFLYLHGFDTHGQYIPPEGLHKTYVDPAYTGALTGSSEEQKALREEGVIQGHINLTKNDARFLRAIYDEKVADMDKRIASFMSSYAALRGSQKTIFVITSNHGDEFYEHGRIDHGMTLYDEVLHIPLVIVLPGESRGTRISQQVRNIDIFPTLLALVGINPTSFVRNQMQGTSIVPAMQGKNQKLDVLAETSYRYATFKQSLRTWDGWKLITDQESQMDQLFNMNTDPGEAQDISKTDSSRLKRMNIQILDMIDSLSK